MYCVHDLTVWEGMYHVPPGIVNMHYVAAVRMLHVHLLWFLCTLWC